MKKHFISASKTPLSLLSVALLGGLSLACAKTSTNPTEVARGASCHELSGDEAVLNHFYEPGTVVSVTPLEEKMFIARASQPMQPVGASMYLPAEKDINAPYLRRVLACHAASGQSAHPNDPLHPVGGPVTDLAVRETGNGYAVDVLSDDPRVAKEILQRARAFGGGTTSVEVEQLGAVNAVPTQM